MKKHLQFPFTDSPDTAAFVCCHVLFENDTILRIVHDDEGYWQFLCGANHSARDARIISLQEAYNIDHSIAEVAGMNCGERAERQSGAAKWIVTHEK